MAHTSEAHPKLRRLTRHPGSEKARQPQSAVGFDGMKSMTKTNDVLVGENLAEHLLDLVAGAGPADDIVIDPGDLGYKEVTWSRAFGSTAPAAS